MAAALGALFAGALLAFGLASAPAAATQDPNAGTLDTSVVSVEKSTDGNDDLCTGSNICRKVPWCPPATGKPPVGITADAAPVVLLGDEKTECVKFPKVDYVCCVSDESGTANVHVIVGNDNPFKMKVKAQLADGTPIVKWIDGKAKTKFVFKGVANGDYLLKVSVWAGDDTWCSIKPQLVKVKCAPPSPSQSPSPSVSPEPTQSPEPSQSTNPGDQLPQTGARVGLITTGGVATVLAGAGIVFLARRRRNMHEASIE